MTSASPGQLVLLVPSEYATELAALAQRLGYAPVTNIDTRAGLEHAFGSGTPRLLLSFCTGVIVAPEILERPGLVAVNVHGAPPSYPGRDPHHFAAYEDAQEYGATLHVMTRQVDQGPILRVSTEPVPSPSAPVDLLHLGIRHGTQLALRFLEDFAASGLPAPDPALRWTGPVRRRSDFLALCRIEPGIERREFERRLRATAMPGHDNLVMVLHGRSFRLRPE
jgi:methionyl-tRNA formyltransferase